MSSGNGDAAMSAVYQLNSRARSVQTYRKLGAGTQIFKIACNLFATLSKMKNDISVEIKQGKLRGKTMLDYRGGEFAAFFGIPYAKAPVGDLRFKAPEPPEPWEGTRNATKELPECPSWDMYFSYYVGQEDNCLHLNVYTKEIPQGEETKKKPVMVWIHGGAFMFGSNKTELYGPDYLMSEDIVLVAPNYRLGVLGFLSLQDQSLGVPGNAGLKDQAMALRWVQNNIEKFGGDPNNVTIFGESAGSASVHYLTLSPSTKGLFHKAILQSGTALNGWAQGKPNALEIAKAMGYKDTDEKTVLEKLRKENTKNIVTGQYKVEDIFESAAIRPFGPVVEPPSDNAFLTKPPLEILKAGEQHQIPMIVGYNSMEGIFFELVRKTRFLKLPNTFERDIPYELELEQNNAKELSQKIKKFYFGNDDLTEENLECYYMLKGDTNFVYSIQKTIKLLQQTTTQPLFVYRMSLDGPLNLFKKFGQLKYFKSTFFLNFLTKLSNSYAPSIKIFMQSMSSKMPGRPVTDGVCHADDLYYLFQGFFSPQIKVGSDEEKYVRRFVKLWTNFAKVTDPTPFGDDVVGAQKWNSLKSEKLDMFEIGEELRMIGNEADEKRMEFWEGVYKAHNK